jgi:hypothetical protein
VYHLGYTKRMIHRGCAKAYVVRWGWPGVFVLFFLVSKCVFPPLYCGLSTKDRDFMWVIGLCLQPS